MHTVTDAFNCSFICFGSSLDHVREAFTFVWDVVRLIKADFMPPLQLKQLMKLVVGHLPMMYTKFNDWLTHDSQPFPDALQKRRPGCSPVIPVL